MRVYFHGDSRLGRFGSAGHMLEPAERNTLEKRRRLGNDLPWWHVGSKRAGKKGLDTELAPKPKDKLGIAALHHENGWTALAFWDRSGDSRGNSNSVFIAEGEHSFAAMKQIAAEHFPRLWERCKGDALVLWESSS